MIFNCGAPSHLDLWDMKPEATEEVRGQFHPIATNVPGIHVSELLPRMARRMHQLAILRTVHHGHAQHNSGMYWTTVGQPYRVDSTLINPSPTDLPGLGTLVGWLAERDDYAATVPAYVIAPKPHCDSFQYITPGQYGGCLGSRFDPFVLNGDPNSSDFRVPNLTPIEGLPTERMHRRRDLLRRLDAPPDRAVAQLGTDHDASLDRALQLLSSDTAAGAFDLAREPDAVRDRYGRHSWGQSHLLARRLIEAGSRFVAAVNGPSIVWDTHNDNFNRLKNQLVPPMEQAYAALLDDLSERGLLESTLVLWIGDFGRTPKVNNEAGRDHWPQCFSAVLAGGGIQGGQVVGRSDSQGAFPAERPVTPADIHATVFAALGYDASAIHYHTADGRPMPLSAGQPIGEVL